MTQGFQRVRNIYTWMGMYMELDGHHWKSTTFSKFTTSLVAITTTTTTINTIRFISYWTANKESGN